MRNLSQSRSERWIGLSKRERNSLLSQLHRLSCPLHIHSSQFLLTSRVEDLTLQERYELIPIEAKSLTLRIPAREAETLFIQKHPQSDSKTQRTLDSKTENKKSR